MTTDTDTTGAADAVLLVGWDGAPYEHVKDMLDNDELPALKSLADNGYVGPLETVPYVMSSCAWSTFLTGKNAGKHGVFDFYSNEFREGTYFREPIDSTARDGSDLGELLNDRGRRIGQINVPMTYPIGDIEGFAVGGMISPGVDADRFVHPEDFFNGYDLSEYRIDVGEGKDTDRETFLEAIHDTVESRMDLACYCLERSEDLDVFFVVFTCPDRLSHYFFHYHDEDHPFRANEDSEDLKKYANVLTDLYRNLDDLLAELVEQFEAKYGKNALTCVVSDHGMRSLERVFHVNKWLDRHGYLTFKDEFDDNGDKISRKLDDRVQYIFGKVDWEETTAYSMGKRGAIYVNLEGREPSGIVPPERYDEVVDSLREDLTEVVDPETDIDIVDAIHTRDDLFHGDHIDRAPDVMLLLKDGYYPFGYAFELEKPNLFSTNNWSDMPFVLGIEDGDGIFVASGPGIKSNETDVDIGLEDITPFLLHYLGHSVPEDMDGTVPKDLLINADRKVDYETADAGSEREESGDIDETDGRVKDRLRDLGYL
jgi:predicted AlkP superfamily phosphohydrolase/phosphomutase